MKRIFKNALIVLIGLVFVFVTYRSEYLVGLLHAISNDNANTAAMLFFVIFYLNIITLFVFIFLTFRFLVNYILNARKGDFGLSLKTKLIGSFVFFSVLPTIILLFISVKFVNANYEKWLPKEVLDTYYASREQEAKYISSLEMLIKTSAYSDIQKLPGSFAIRNNGKAVRARDKETFDHLKAFLQTIRNAAKSLQQNETRIVPLSSKSIVIIKLQHPEVTGIYISNVLSGSWEILSSRTGGVGNEIRITQLSYYVMLGVITFLILFSALWLAFTLARDFTVPIEMLAKAAEQVSLGNYDVRIEDVASNAELEKLSLSFRAMVTDIRQSRRSADDINEQLRQKSKYNEILLKNVNTAVISLSESKALHSWNLFADVLFLKDGKKHLGLPLFDVVGQSVFHKIFHPLLQKLETFPESRPVSDYVGEIAGRFVHLHISSVVLRLPEGDKLFVFFINDYTAVARAQRLAAWRDVARRLAHEIRNPLTPIRLSAQRIQRKFASQMGELERGVLQDSVQLIVQSVDSIGRLVDEFSHFARLPSPVLKFGNLMDPIKIVTLSYIDNTDHVPLIIEFFEWSEVTGKFEPKENIDHINSYFDQDQIVQMLANLIANAIAVSVEEKTPVYFCVYKNEFGKRCRICIKDYGTGIEKELREKVFEPYFSTKSSGTGLGLVIVQQIVRDHDGELNLLDNEPKGAIFEVILPII